MEGRSDLWAATLPRTRPTGPSVPRRPRRREHLAAWRRRRALALQVGAERVRTAAWSAAARTSDTVLLARRPGRFGGRLSDATRRSASDTVSLALGTPPAEIRHVRIRPVLKRQPKSGQLHFFRARPGHVSGSCLSLLRTPITPSKAVWRRLWESRFLFPPVDSQDRTRVA